MAEGNGDKPSVEDAWKGEGLIRGIKPKSGRFEATKLVNIIYHSNRRKLGLPPAGKLPKTIFIKGKNKDV